MLKTFTGLDKLPAESVSMEQYNKELDNAMIRIAEGHFTTLEELQKEMQSF